MPCVSHDVASAVGGHRESQHRQVYITDGTKLDPSLQIETMTDEGRQDLKTAETATGTNKHPSFKSESICRVDKRARSPERPQTWGK